MRTKIKKIVAVLATTSISGCMLLNYPVGTFDIKLSAKAANGGVVIDETTFPDPIFRKYIMDNFDQNDSFLSVEEMEDTFSIDVRNKGISDLSGIEYFTNLSKLDCYNNLLTTLDISKNTSLIDLNCDNNQLTSLDVSNLKLLESLYCNNNQLTSLDISNNKVLTGLQCMNNQITSIDISNNKELKAVFLRNNKLTNLDLSNNTSLHSLNCDNNQLTSLDLSNNIALTGLGCEGNQLTVLDLSNNKKLYEFGCSNNYLTTLDLSNNPKLEYLYCSGNRLTCLDLTNNTSRYLRLECFDNVYEINLIGNTFDLSTLPDGFDITKTSDWKNASIDGNTLKFHGYSNDGKITYRYDHGNGYDSMFTLVVVPTQLEENMVQKIEAQTYTGKAVKPVEIFHNDYKLIEDTDYAITYENNINAGTASYTITSSDLYDNRTGSYTGELTGTFTIEKATPEITPVIPEIEYYTGAELPEITAKSEIDGNIKWATELVNGLNEGENELEWQFTPNDSNNYNVVTGRIIVTAQTAATTIQPSGETTIDIEKSENPEEDDELFVEAGSVQAVFDYNAMIEIEHNHGNKEIKFSYKVVDKEEIEENEAIKEAIEDSDQLFKFDLTDSNGNKVKFNSDSNNGIVTITIPYTKPVSANEVKVYYISPTGEKIDMNGKYDPSTKTITFDTTHFSYYSIVAEYEKETETTTTSTTTTTTTTTTETTTSTTATSTTTPPTTTAVTTTTLPETGYSVIYNYIILAAAAMVIFGIYTILKNREEA